MLTYNQIAEIPTYYRKSGSRNTMAMEQIPHSTERISISWTQPKFGKQCSYAQLCSRCAKLWQL